MMILLFALLGQEKSAYEEVRVKVAVRVDLNADQLAALKDRFERAAQAWWKCTEGQMAFVRFDIVDRCDDGDVIVTNLDSALCREGVYGETCGEKVYLGGRFPIVTFCHEMGHRWFGLPDEYTAPKCARCVMEPWKGIFEFCDGGNHTARGADCWERILKRRKEWKHPNRFGDAPAVRVTIENR